MMFSALLPRNSKLPRRNKAKDSKIMLPYKRTQSPDSPASFESPEIVDINDGRSAESSMLNSNGTHTLSPSSLRAIDETALSSPQLRLEIESESLSDWFPRDMLKAQDKLEGGEGKSGRLEDSQGPTVSSGVSVNGSGHNNNGMTTVEEPGRSEVVTDHPSDRVVDYVQPLENPSFVNSEELHGGSKSDQDSLQQVRKLPPSPTLPPVRRLPSPSAVRRLPSPIKIPKASQGPRIQHPRSTSMHSRDSHLESPMSGDDASSVSGSTIARVLIGNSFILSADSRRSRRSGLTRQDSATLGEHSFLNSPYWRTSRRGCSDIIITPDSKRGSLVPPVPPVPFGVELLSVRSSRTSAEENRQISPGSESLKRPNSWSAPIDKDDPHSSVILESDVHVSRRISRISEASSPAASPHTPNLLAVKDNASSVCSSRAPSPLKASSLKASENESPSTSESTLQSDSRTKPQDSDEPPSAPIPGSAGSGQTIENLLTEYSFASPKNPMLSPTASLSRSSLITSPSFQSARDSKQNVRGMVPIGASVREWAPSNRRPDIAKQRSLLPIGEKRNSSVLPRSPSESQLMQHDSRFPYEPSPPSTASSSSSRINVVDISHSPAVPGRLAPLNGNRFGRQRSGSTPNPITVVRDSKDHRAYNITVSPDLYDASLMGDSPSPGEGRQTFPETPNAFSPMFTPGSQASPQRRAIDSIISTIPEAPETPMSAGASGVSFGSAAASLAQQVMLSRAATSAARARPLQKMARRMHPYTRAAPSDHEESGVTDESDPPAAEPSTQTEPPPPVQAMPSPSEPTQSQNRDQPHSEAPTFALDIFNRHHVASPPEPEPVAPHTLLDDATQPAPIVTSPVISTVPYDFSRIAAPSPDSPCLSEPPSYDSVVLDRPSSGSFGQPPTITESPGAATETNARAETFTSQTSAPHSDDATSPRIRGSRPLLSRNGTSSPRMRPPLPIGPRKPSVSQREESISGPSANANDAINASIRQKLELAVNSPPKFYTPPPKWRGYTMDAAKWTFTSEQLQSIVSRAIRQSAEASSIRLLQLETLDQDIPEEMHRLGLLAVDLKARYKFTARKRWTLLSTLSVQLENPEISSSAGLRTVNDLLDVSSTLDHLTEELHSIDVQVLKLRSLCDVHSRSALAMALRKLNNSFLKEVSETQALRARVEALEAEKDDAWKQAQDIAVELDNLHDKMVDAGNLQEPDSSRNSNHQSDRISAMRKSSARASRAGLHSSTMRRSRSSVTSISTISTAAAKPTPSSDEVPPLPAIPPRHSNLGILTGDISTRSSMGLSTLSSSSPTAESRAMQKAQQELYEMLGIPEQRGARRRPRSLSGPSDSQRSSNGTYHVLNQRPLSAASSGQGHLSAGFSSNTLPADERVGILATLDMI